MGAIANDDFFDSLPVFVEFEGVADASNYQPLPDDWLLAVADIVGSTKAIQAGRYKAVNMAGASVISALLNALGGHNYPFVFGGDGALVAIPASATARAREALASVQAWVHADLQLTLRAALVPMSEIKAQGLDVRVARFSASPEVFYAMFTGGGSSWAEAQMKAGKYAIAAGPSGSHPDLTGLSCRWNPIQARNGEILSIIAVPGDAGPTAPFQRLVADIVAIAAEQNRGAHPLPADGPPITFNTSGVETEARATARKGQRLFRKMAILAQIALTVALDRLGLHWGKFDPRQYKRDVAQNSDFRKFDDGLKMTIDIDPIRLQRIEALLEEASKAGIARFGLHRQDSALMTCLVPTSMARNHMHFIDGASGGYAMAASNLKAKLS